MLTRLALMFVLHVMVAGVFFGRRLDLLQFSKLAWVFGYLLLFYIAWGLLFALVPQLVVPELAGLAF